MVDAAAHLFAERGPAAVSLREVARRAGVNLGLIHRHIGSKEDLLAAVLQAQPGIVPVGVSTPEEGAALMLWSGFSPPLYTLILVRAALDGYDVARLGVDFPIMDRAATMLRARLDPLDADLRAALAAAMLLGWHAVGRTMLDVLGHADLPPDEVVKSLQPGLAALLAAPA